MFILNNISSTCSDPGLAAIISIIKKVMNIVWIIGPILAMVGAIIAFTKMMSNPDDKKYKSLFKNMIIALLMLFFIPVIVNTVMAMFDDSFEVSACWNQAESINATGSQDSTYIDPNDDDKSNIYTDPDEYETGTPPESGSTSSTGSTSTTYSSYTSSKNNIKYNVYSQTDSRWSTVQYPGSTDTIGSVGCMITSVAVVSSAYNNTITPKVVFDKYRHSYPRNSITGLTSNAFSCTSGSTSPNDIISALNSGKVVVIKVYGSKKGGSSTFTSSQHYMALLDASGSQIYVGNGYSNSGSGAIGWHSSSAVLTSVQTADYCTPSQTLLSKYS